MKCPLLNIGRKPYNLSGEPIGIDCLKEECAWWDHADEHCIVQTLPFELNRLGSTLQAIEQKMPHEEQFRK